MGSNGVLLLRRIDVVRSDNRAIRGGEAVLFRHAGSVSSGRLAGYYTHGFIMDSMALCGLEALINSARSPS